MDNNNNNAIMMMMMIRGFIFAGKQPAAFGRWGQHPDVVLVGENPGRDFLLIFPPLVGNFKGGREKGSDEIKKRGENIKEEKGTGNSYRIEEMMGISVRSNLNDLPLIYL